VPERSRPDPYFDSFTGLVVARALTTAVLLGVFDALHEQPATPAELAVRLGLDPRGGGQVAQQYLAAGLLDELELHVVPVVLGDGARLFDNLRDAEVQLEQVRAVEAPGVTHLKYRSVK
jgi:hypothetical protein